MAPPSSKHAASRIRPRIVFSNGFWWFHHPDRIHPIRLDPMFSKCGWSVGDLAEALGVGQRSFARVVGESLGITGQVWLCRLRAVVACHLLREGGKIRPIARQLGFNDDSNFTREFKKIVGVLPSHYIAGERTRSEMD